MDKDQFIVDLQYHMEGQDSVDWKVDWEDAPLPYKLYRDLPSYPFSMEIPLSLKMNTLKVTSPFQQIGVFLWYVYGLTSYSESIASNSDSDAEDSLYQSFRRYVPSGGALYPNELYIYLKIEEIPDGIYHYDVAHHRLLLVREGNYDSYIESAINQNQNISKCFGVVFVSTMFWKNFFKYHHFAYRLQALDTGVVLGQLLETAKYFDYETSVLFQFLDRAINHLIGIDEKEESIYSIIPLSLVCQRKLEKEKVTSVSVTAEQLIKKISRIRHHHYSRSKKIKDYSSLLEMNQASMLESTQCFNVLSQLDKQSTEGSFFPLPNHNRLNQNKDIASLNRRRFSPDSDFMMKQLNLEQLATLLQETFSSSYYHNDLHNNLHYGNLSVSIFGFFNGIEKIEAGAYRYAEQKKALFLVNSGDYRLQLQRSLSMNNVNLFQVPLCFHIMGEGNQFMKTFGYRGYRILQMEAGMLVQRLLSIGGAIGLGGHPLLGYNARISDELYGTEGSGLMNLIQLPMGHYRSRAWLKGSLIG